MKVTKSRLKQIIKEEIENALFERADDSHKDTIGLLVKTFNNVDEERAKKIAGVIASGTNPETVMETIDQLLGGNGVRQLTNNNIQSDMSNDFPVAIYVSQDNKEYSPCVLHHMPEKAWYVTSPGYWSNEFQEKQRGEE